MLNSQKEVPMGSKKHCIRCFPNYDLLSTPGWENYSAYVINDNVKTAEDCFLLNLKAVKAVKDASKPEDAYKALKEAFPDFFLYDANDYTNDFEGIEDAVKKLVINLFNPNNILFNDEDNYDQSFYFSNNPVVTIETLLSSKFVQVAVEPEEGEDVLSADNKKMKILPKEFTEEFNLLENYEKLIEIFDSHKKEKYWYIPFKEEDIYNGVDPEDMPKSLRKKYIDLLSKMYLSTKGASMKLLDTWYDNFLDDLEDALDSDKIDEDTYDTLEEVLNKWAEKCGISVNYDEDF